MDYPLKPMPKTSDVSIQADTVVNDTRHGRSQSSPVGPQKLRLTLAYNDGITIDGAEETRELWVFLNRLRGRSTAFDIVLPGLSDGVGSELSDGSVTAVVQSGFEVQTSGWPAGATVRRAGDLVQIGRNYRAYVLAQDLVADVNGRALLVTAGPLLSSLGVGDPVRVSAIRLRMMLDSDTVQRLRLPGGIQRIKSISMTEALTFAPLASLPSVFTIGGQAVTISGYRITV